MFVIAASITAVLSLDATVVLLTPVVLAAVRDLAIGQPGRHEFDGVALAPGQFQTRRG